MEENQILKESEISLEKEPINEIENSQEEILDSVSNQEEGQAIAPSEQLILGKFKSVDDLSKAYQELQKLQGTQSAELGALRKNVGALNFIEDAWSRIDKIKEQASYLKEVGEKYEKYFQDPSFNEMYREAFKALNTKLDTDKFVNLLEGYVYSRIYAHEQERLKKEENNRILDAMSYSKNPINSIMPPKKKLDEMSKDEIDALLEKFI